MKKEYDIQPGLPIVIRINVSHPSDDFADSRNTFLKIVREVTTAGYYIDNQSKVIDYPGYYEVIVVPVKKNQFLANFVRASGKAIARFVRFFIGPKKYWFKS